MLILAGAGSGKTRVLTHRLAYLLDQGVPPERILGLTFTNKAAAEMRARSAKLQSLKGTRAEPLLATFHRLGVLLLREFIEQTNGGFTQRFTIFDSQDSLALIKEILTDQSIKLEAAKPKVLMSQISNAKNQLLSPHDILSEYQGEPWGPMLSTVYQQYQQRLKDLNALDFDDLIQKTIELLRHHDPILEQLQNRWDYVMVDEYQDTNLAQYELVSLLTKKHQNLCVVGDDHQSIYAFRGADYRNILGFQSVFPTAKVILLEQNYRSTKHILNCANQVIERNRSGRKKSLWTAVDHGEKVTVATLSNEKSEAKFIAGQIKELFQKGWSWSDCAILYRANALSRVLEEALMEQQIPYRIVGGTRFFERKEIKDLLAYARLLHNPYDALAFKRALNVPHRGIGAATEARIWQHAQSQNLNWIEALKSDIPNIATSKKQVLNSLAEQFQRWDQQFSAEKSLTALFRSMIQELDFLAWLKDGTAQGESRIENVEELFSLFPTYENGTTESLSAFLEGTSLLTDQDQSDDTSELVSLMTIHSAKGLEFPCVFLPAWEEGVFPSSMALMEDPAAEEERRLAYVAITRARESLTISSAKQRMLFGSTQFNPPSRFLEELPESDTAGYEKPFSAENSVSALRSKTAPTNFKVGQKVWHQEYGPGVILGIHGDVISLATEQAGFKRVVASVAPLKAMS